MPEQPASWRGAVLFVDDEAKSRKYFQRVFADHGEVLVAEDGRAGLDLYRSREQEISVVVTDQIMPRMTGLELLAALRDAGASATRILSTAYTDTDLIEVATEAGLIDDFIAKPWDLDEVGNVLARADARHHQRFGTDRGRGQVA